MVSPRSGAASSDHKNAVGICPVVVFHHERAASTASAPVTPVEAVISLLANKDPKHLAAVELE